MQSSIGTQRSISGHARPCRLVPLPKRIRRVSCAVRAQHEGHHAERTHALHKIAQSSTAVLIATLVVLMPFMTISSPPAEAASLKQKRDESERLYQEQLRKMERSLDEWTRKNQSKLQAAQESSAAPAAPGKNKPLGNKQ